MGCLTISGGTRSKVLLQRNYFVVQIFDTIVVEEAENNCKNGKERRGKLEHKASQSL